MFTPDVKAQICHYEQNQDYFALSKAYLNDQDIEKSFKTFLLALEKKEQLAPPAIQENEKKVFDEAVVLYLNEGTKDHFACGKKLIEKIEKIALENPKYLHLNLLLSIAYANSAADTTQFNKFFDKFYQIYPYLHDHFLAYKTIGVLHLRLMQIAKTDEEKKYQQQKGIEFLSKALTKNHRDLSIFKMLVDQALQKKDKGALLSYLEKMVESKVAILRGDIVFYVNAALSISQPVLAEKILNLAKKEYSYSRSIIEAEECIKRWKEKSLATTSS